jgi:cyclic pyranopterin phosphate synthase
MPEKGISFEPQNKLLTHKEIIRIVQVAAKLGVNKIRFTGGEPLLRKDLVELVNGAAEIPGIDSLNLTTNGVLLANAVEALKDAGLTGLNVSIDTLEKEKYKDITRRDYVDQACKGLEAAKRVGIPSIKVNVVALRGFNDHELSNFVHLTKNYPITVRFIELMPFDAQQIWKTGKFFRAENIKAELINLFPDIKTTSGSATEFITFNVPGYEGKVAVIPSYSRDLCGACNRIRLTATGQIRNCLYAKNNFSVRDTIRKGGSDKDIADLFLQAMWQKSLDGWAAQETANNPTQSMTKIGG